MTENRTDNGAWRLVCPQCREADLQPAAGAFNCPGCGAEFTQSAAVSNLLPAERSAFFARFLESYTRIRKAEGRDSEDPEAYRALPNCPATHPLAWQWTIRRQSYYALMKLIGNTLRPGAKILDLGAGVGWLSNRLSEAGYSPCAVDLSDDNGDGLGAARHYDGGWPRIVAEFDCLPVADAQADAVVFNGSFHYSTDYLRTLREAQRVLRPGGLIVILDSPVYRDSSSGKRMLEEQSADFEERFGERSDSLSVSGFLTWSLLANLTAETGLVWHHRKPWYGWRWAIRPIIAKLRRQREPARFVLLWAEAS